MGYDQAERSNSSGAIVAVIDVVLLVGFIGLVAVGGVAFFWLTAVRMETQEAIVAEERAVAEAYWADAEAQRLDAEAMLLPQPRPFEPGTLGSHPDLTVNVTEGGNMSIDGEQIELPELRERLAQLKEESGKAVSVLLSVDANCRMRTLRRWWTCAKSLERRRFAGRRRLGIPSRQGRRWCRSSIWSTHGLVPLETSCWLRPRKCGSYSLASRT